MTRIIRDGVLQTLPPDHGYIFTRPSDGAIKPPARCSKCGSDAARIEGIESWTPAAGWVRRSGLQCSRTHKRTAEVCGFFEVTHEESFEAPPPGQSRTQPKMAPPRPPAPPEPEPEPPPPLDLPPWVPPVLEERPREIVSPVSPSKETTMPKYRKVADLSEAELRELRRIVHDHSQQAAAQRFRLNPQSLRMWVVREGRIKPPPAPPDPTPLPAITELDRDAAAATPEAIAEATRLMTEERCSVDEVVSITGLAPSTVERAARAVPRHIKPSEETPAMAPASTAPPSAPKPSQDPLQEVTAILETIPLRTFLRFSPEHQAAITQFLSIGKAS